MMKEIFQSYGPVWELWWDGANGEGPNGKKQVYDWEKFKNTVRQLSPKTMVFSDIGPDIRWCGNENGLAGETNWGYLDTSGFTPGAGAPPADTLNRGNINGKSWIPAECDVSIRPGWFYHPEQDMKVKSPEQLFELYLKSVGRGANLLLNVPPDKRGLVAGADSASLMEFKHLRDAGFSDNLLRQARSYYEFPTQDITFRSMEKSGAFGANLQNFVVALQQPEKMNCIILREAIHLGQTVRKFRIILFNGPNKVREIDGTTVGRKRILTFPTTQITSFRVYLDDAQGSDNISGVAAYLMDEKLIEK